MVIRLFGDGVNGVDTVEWHRTAKRSRTSFVAALYVSVRESRRTKAKSVARNSLGYLDPYLY
jgi:hypothetical protein